jgi:hypothetical protein
VLSRVAPPDSWVSSRSKADLRADAKIVGQARDPVSPGSGRSPGAPQTGWAPTTEAAKRGLVLATDDSAQELVQPWSSSGSESAASPPRAGAALEADTEEWSPPSPPRNAWGRGLADPAQGADADKQPSALEHAPRYETLAFGRPAANDLVEEDLVLSPIGMADSPRSAVNFDEPSIFSPTKISTSNSGTERSPTRPPPSATVIAPIYPGNVAPLAPPPLSPKVIRFGALSAVR